jgi:hypothetical protein
MRVVQVVLRSQGTVIIKGKKKGAEASYGVIQARIFRINNPMNGVVRSDK